MRGTPDGKRLRILFDTKPWGSLAPARAEAYPRVSSWSEGSPGGSKFSDGRVGSFFINAAGTDLSRVNEPEARMES